MHCGACVQVQRNGTVAKEAALRWSALTRPVDRASGATVERAPRSVACRRLRNLQLHTLRLLPTASHVPRPVANTSRQRETTAALLQTFFLIRPRRPEEISSVCESERSPTNCELNDYAWKRWK